MRTFVPTLDVPLENGSKALCFHGSPRSFSDWIFATTSDDDVGAMFDGQLPALLIGGHTHLQMLRRFGQSADRQPGQRRPAVQPVVAEGDPRRPLGRVRRDRPSGDRVQIDLQHVPYDVDGLLALLRAERHAALLVVDRLVERLLAARRRSNGR